MRSLSLSLSLRSWTERGGGQSTSYPSHTHNRTGVATWSSSVPGRTGNRPFDSDHVWRSGLDTATTHSPGPLLATVVIVVILEASHALVCHISAGGNG